jgi:16S rRNA G966 N2-methylase RsmD
VAIRLHGAASGNLAPTVHALAAVAVTTARVPSREVRVFEVPPAADRLTHYLFRYPAKFHPPVARALVEAFSERGDVVLDPFCGSGTLLVEASALGRSGVGTDVDPIAVAVTNAKVHRYDARRLRWSAQRLLSQLASLRRSSDEYGRRMFTDLTDREFAAQIAPVEGWVPAIPNLHHWFRRYVIVDLAHIRRVVMSIDMPETHRMFFGVVFASIVRNSSNADPVPVSGLEVTKWMREKEAVGRRVDPFALFDKAVTAAVEAAVAFSAATTPDIRARAMQRDATALRLPGQRVDAVITSPPYHGAVDYYRRHQLEMFWLGLTTSQQERLQLLQHYIGRPHVPPRHRWLAEPLPTALAKEWESRIRAVSPDRANGFRHYLTAMTAVFNSLASLLDEGNPAVLVVGHSSWNSAEIPTTDLFEEIAGDHFRLDDVLSYSVKNRYMSYERRNAADIGTEYVLVFRRTGTLAG